MYKHLHAHVKERKQGKSTYFHVHVKSKINGRKIESQKYYKFNIENKSQVLTLANKKAIHLCHRHDQIRRARENKISLANLFFRQDGTIKYIILNKRNRPKRLPYIELVGQKSVDKKQMRIARVLAINDPDLVIFDKQFNLIFKWLCKCLGIKSNNPHVKIFKAAFRSVLVDEYHYQSSTIKSAGKYK